jgi:hypothetical protein
MAAFQEFAWFRERVVQIPGRFLIRHKNFHATSPVPRSPPGISPGNTAERRLRFAKPGRRAASTAWLASSGLQTYLHSCGTAFATKEVEDDVVDIAERAVQFAGVAEGTARMVARRSSLAEYLACHHTRQTASPLRTSEFSRR